MPASRHGRTGSPAGSARRRPRRRRSRPPPSSAARRPRSTAIGRTRRPCPTGPHLSTCSSNVSTSRPSGRRTRCISLRAFGGSGTNLRQLSEQTTLKRPSSHGSAMASPRTISAVPAAIRSARRRRAMPTWISDASRPATCRTCDACSASNLAEPQPTSSSRRRAGGPAPRPSSRRAAAPSSASAGRRPIRADRAAPRRTEARTTCAAHRAALHGAIAGRSRQWLGAVPAAMRHGPRVNASHAAATVGRRDTAV